MKLGTGDIHLKGGESISRNYTPLVQGSSPNQGLPGVQRAEVNFREKEARVIFDPARVSVDQLIRAVKGTGFRASLKGRN